MGDAGFALLGPDAGEIAVGRVLGEIGGGDIQPQPASRLNGPDDIPEIDAHLGSLSGFIFLPFRQVRRDRGDSAPDIIGFPVREHLAELGGEGGILYIGANLQPHLDSPFYAKGLRHRLADPAEHILPVSRLRLQQRSRLRDGGQDALRAMGRTGILRIIVEACCLPRFRLRRQLQRPVRPQIVILSISIQYRPGRIGFPAILPHDIGPNPFLRRLLLLQQQIKPFQQALDISVLQMLLLAPLDTLHGHMVPAADI